jgi:hypothetical protein
VPKPPTKIVEPSLISATAASIESQNLLIIALL